MVAMVLTLIALVAAAQEVKLRIIETSDIHGSFVAYDFINQRPARGSMARAYTYIKDARAEYGDRLLLIDNGDILQGQPMVYYYDYIATDEENIAASMLNYVGYNVHTFGNHDIEAGHAVYDKWTAETKAPIVCANLVDAVTDEPYVRPYEVVDCGGVRVAVIGMLTTATPNWISEEKYKGLKFVDVAEAAKRWLPEMREKADIVVGLFHTGLRGGIETDVYEENATERVAKTIDGFDAIFFGHDHTVCCEKMTNDAGREVWLLNPANAVMNLAELNITVEKGAEGARVKDLEGRIVDVRDMPIDSDYERRFEAATQKVKDFTSKEIGVLNKTMWTRDAFFGPCEYIDLVQRVQLEVTGADISMCAPLQYNAEIKAGVLRGSDMFNIYKYENKLCTVTLTGKEIKDYLEYSYALWTNMMETAADHIMLIEERTGNDGQKYYGFDNATFNFDSAVGIDYEVDVTKPQGEKITILGMSDGTDFDEGRTYKVAMSSYRANNGGELLTKGAGLKKEEIEGRIEWESELDMRNYIMQYIEKEQTLSPTITDNWRFVPEDWTTAALARDRALLFGD